MLPASELLGGFDRGLAAGPTGEADTFAAGSSKPMPMFAGHGMARPGVVRIPLMILLLILVGPFAARAAPFQTRAPTALLVDYNSGATLFEKNADRPVAPESTTKILTAEIVFSRTCGRQAGVIGSNGDLAEGRAGG